MATQSERRTKTRAALLGAARRLFIDQGYAETSMAQILEAAAVSKGALYHHFASKEAVLEAIYLEASRQAIDAAQAQTDPDASALEQLRAAARAWFAEIRKPEIARMLFEIGPQGLGARRVKLLEDQNSLAALTTSLEAAQKAGEITISSVEVSARLLNALLSEAALLYLEKGGAALAATDEAIDAYLNSLRAGS
ncbi:MAG: helix-turn-helix domain-containing protein [Pseudomonadota bacterium]